MRKDKGIYRKDLFCSQLRASCDGEVGLDIFLLSSVKYSSTSRGTKWLEVKLEDRTGSLPARVWTENIRQEYEDYEGKVVSVKGKINFYAGHPELRVELMRPLNDGEFLVDEVCRTLDEETIKNDTESIRTMMKKVGDDGLRGFVGKILNSENLDKMAVLPVHISGHHNYRGGMLEHTMEVAFGAYFSIPPR